MLILTATAPSAADKTDEKARCAGLIAFFDDVVVSRFDQRLLVVDVADVVEARTRRDQAEADCEAGRTWFGIREIEAALERVGIPPPDWAPPPPDL